MKLRVARRARYRQFGDRAQALFKSRPRGEAITCFCAYNELRIALGRRLQKFVGEPVNQDTKTAMIREINAFADSITNPPVYSIIIH